MARVPLPDGGYYEDLCFHAQQAAEKALKALYVFRGWTFRYTHDLEKLITDLRKKGLSIPDEVQESVTLTGYAFEARYPGVADPVTQAEYTRAVTLAERMVEWALTQVKGADR